MNKKNYQDSFYKKIEFDFFFDRTINNNNFINKMNFSSIRLYKKKIYNVINKNYKITEKTKILEIGCFIGDLLNYFRNEKHCKVFGIEPSKKACEFSKQKFNLNIENKTFYHSKFFNIEMKNIGFFNVIIFDDVLSWVDRNLILSSIAVTDWLLADDGIIFIRDFCPSKMFAHPNHHHKNKKIYNFKNKNGHKEFFINSGKYKQIYFKKYFTEKMQKISIKNNESMLWSDTIIKKVKNFTHPIIKI